MERPGDHARADEAADARDDPARRVRRPRRAGGRGAARGRPRHARHASARCRGCSPWRWCSATSGRAARGAASASRSSASTRCCSTSWPAGAPSRAATRCSPCCSSSATRPGDPPTDRHLRDQLVALLAAGHDTSAASLAWAFERLARHPAVHARLRDGDPAYLDAVVKEVLRVRPALTIAPRRLLEPVADRRADACPPACRWPPACGWRCAARTSGPRPPRSGPSAGSTGPPPNPMSWIPFGGGVRRCAGAPFAEMEMREVLRAAADLTIRPGRGPSPSAPGAARSSSRRTAAARCSWDDRGVQAGV